MGIRVAGLSKQLGVFRAVGAVSLDVENGSLVALLGPSGSGKSTLLRLIAGLEDADDGRIWITEEEATSRSVEDRHVGFVNRHPKLRHFRHRKVSHPRAGLWRRFRGGFALAAPAVPLLAHGFRDWLHWLSFVIDTGGTALAVPPHTSSSGVGGGTPPMPDEEEPVGLFLPSGGQAPGLAVLILRLVALSSKSTRM
jgi:hypothetical protein